MKYKVILVLSFFFFSCSNENPVQFKKIKKGTTLLSGTFINDTIPHGRIEIFDEQNRIISIKNYKFGMLDGESTYYYSNTGRIKIRTNYIMNQQTGYKITYDSSGNLISKTNYYFNKQIGPDYSYDSSGRVCEYSFLNFENNMLYFCSLDKKKNTYIYPSDAYLIKATTEPLSIDGKDKLYIFLYLPNPPKLRLTYSICATNEKDSLITVKEVPSSNFYYEYYLTLRDNKQKVAIVLDKYDSSLQKRIIVRENVKTSYP